MADYDDVTFDRWEGPPHNPPEVWDDVKRRFPLGAMVTGRVIVRQPFGAFLDLGPGALALMEIPSLPRIPGTGRVDYPEIGDELTGVVVDHRDTNRQIRVINPDKFR